MNGASELSFDVDGLCIRALAWGDSSQPPILALHGWLDNAASFARLAPLLSNYYVVAPDLPGHGQSSHHSLDAGYQVWDDLSQLKAIPDQLGWQHFILMGHSRGAMISSLLAAIVPDRVSHLILLDGLLPEPLSGKDFVKQLQRHHQERTQLLTRENRIAKDLCEAAKQREKAGVPHDAAMLLAQRGTKTLEDGALQWTSDPRLRGASALKLSYSQRLAVTEALKMPLLLLVAAQGLKAQYDVDFSHEEGGLPQHAEIQELSGGHHFHMEGEVESLATAIMQFLCSPSH